MAIVNDREECRVLVLFDTGSQMMFKTAKAASSLGSEAVQEDSLWNRAFGSKHTSVSKKNF